MTTQQLQSIGYIAIISEKEIKQISYKDYLNYFDNSEMRMWVEECTEQAYLKGNETIDEYRYDNLTEEEQDDYTDIGKQPNGKFEIWAQKVNRKAERCNNFGEFESEEEAELEIYERTEWYIGEKNWDAPIFFESEEEAIADLAASFEKPVEVITRYLSIKAITDRKNKEHRAKVDLEYTARKAYLATAVPAEAETIAIDRLFIEGTKELKSKTGNEKSQYSASIMKGLLQRNNIEKIETDFWQVFRILKSKAEKI